MLQVPLADAKAEVPQTVYTVRMSTGGAGGSGMTEQRAGVWLCLVGKDGAAFLHRATPLSDPEVIEQELIQIYQVIRAFAVEDGFSRYSIFAACFSCSTHP